MEIELIESDYHLFWQKYWLNKGFFYKKKEAD